MQAHIHPRSAPIVIRCTCGSEHCLCSTATDTVLVEQCSQCHPAYTGEATARPLSGAQISRFRARAARASTSNLIEL
jgi:large subunit ribosomal protein L31